MNITFILDKINIKGYYDDFYNLDRNLHLNVDKIETIKSPDGLSNDTMVFINEKITNKYHDILVKLTVKNKNWTLSGNFYRQNMSHPIDLIDTKLRLEEHSWKQLNEIVEVFGTGNSDFKIFKINSLFGINKKP